MNNSFVLILAYPESIVAHAQEWYSPFLHWLGIGNKKYVRAGHAALVLIDKYTGALDYHDFGRYVTPFSYGRVRGKETDFELDFPISAEIEDGEIKNLPTILKFLATHPELTHGSGTLYASICDRIDTKKMRDAITDFQEMGFIKYAVFKRNTSNCARFIADVLIAGIRDASVKQRLKRSQWFTPSTIGNVVIADTEDQIYQVSEAGVISKFVSSVGKINIMLFLDQLNGYTDSPIGKTKSQQNATKQTHAQWLGGTGAGAWFELYDLSYNHLFRFRRISPVGRVDCDAIYKITSEGFYIDKPYQFLHDSNCKYFNVEQKAEQFRFEWLKNYSQ